MRHGELLAPGDRRGARRGRRRRGRTSPRSRSASAPARSPACGSGWSPRAPWRSRSSVPVYGVCTLDVLAAEAVDAGAGRAVPGRHRRPAQGGLLGVVRRAGRRGSTARTSSGPPTWPPTGPVVGRRRACSTPRRSRDAVGPEHPDAGVLARRGRPTSAPSCSTRSRSTCAARTSAAPGTPKRGLVRLRRGRDRRRRRRGGRPGAASCSARTPGRAASVARRSSPARAGPRVVARRRRGRASATPSTMAAGDVADLQRIAVAPDRAARGPRAPAARRRGARATVRPAAARGARGQRRRRCAFYAARGVRRDRPAARATTATASDAVVMERPARRTMSRSDATSRWCSASRPPATRPASASSAATPCSPTRSPPASRSTPASAASCPRSPVAGPPRGDGADHRAGLRRRPGSRSRDVDAIAVTSGPGPGRRAAGRRRRGQGARARRWASRSTASTTSPRTSPSTSSSTARCPSPCLALLVCGGHSSLLRVDDVTARRATPLGATIDDAAGEAFDKVARLLGLPFPGGPHIDRAAAVGVRGGDRLPARADLAARPASGTASTSRSPA